MTVSPDLIAHHECEAKVAAERYVAGLTDQSAAADWRAANLKARREIVMALRDSRCLTDIAGALRKNGSYARIYRHMLAPPISQDQFDLLCESYSKNSENKGRPMKAAAAEAVAAAIEKARDRTLTRWLDRRASPRRQEVRKVLHVVTPLLSQQIVATDKRNRLSAEQEGAVTKLLEAKGWSRMNSSLIQTLSDVPAGAYMHKTRFATTTQPQEVDIACGMGKTVVLAMECKVTNDKTNSVKRVNDVLKKATAWQAHWGSFVHTAALLQGVIAYKDVHRLLAAGVLVFWSHKLDDFSAWLDGHTTA